MKVCIYFIGFPIEKLYQVVEISNLNDDSTENISNDL